MSNFMDIVSILVGVVIFGALIGTVASSIAAAASNANISAAGQTMIGLGFLKN